MSQRNKPASILIDLGEMKTMLQWEAHRDGDKFPDVTYEFLKRWLDTNSASRKNIQDRILAWKKITDGRVTYIDTDGNKREA